MIKEFIFVVLMRIKPVHLSTPPELGKPSGDISLQIGFSLWKSNIACVESNIGGAESHISGWVSWKGFCQSSSPPGLETLGLYDQIKQTFLGKFFSIRSPRERLFQRKHYSETPCIVLHTFCMVLHCKPSVLYGCCIRFCTVLHTFALVCLRFE